MQTASDTTVLGNFDAARFVHGGMTSTFFKRDGKYLVRTEGADGKPGEVEIAYTFGVEPSSNTWCWLRRPAPSAGIAWDSRPRAEGGQRWFSLYPEQLRPTTRCTGRAATRRGTISARVSLTTWRRTTISPTTPPCTW